MQARARCAPVSMQPASNSRVQRGHTQDKDKQASSKKERHRKGTAPSKGAGGSSSRTRYVIPGAST
eukprot:11877556-Karenia_brevis.AAC.1